MRDEGATFFCDRPAATVLTAFEQITSQLGHARSTKPTELEVFVHTADAGTCIRLGVPKALALALGRRMARALSRSVRVFTVRAVLDGDDLDCLLDDVLLGKDGSARQGRWGTDLTAEHEDEWMGVCDGKPYYAASILTQDAVAEMLGEEHDQRDQEWWLAPPPSLGSVRLDEIAKQARLAEKTVVTVVAGRDCVRMSDAGTTVTSFVSKDDVEKLRTALAGLLVAP